jgi:GNAT superfamily N-acetyltransferase
MTPFFQETKDVDVFQLAKLLAAGGSPEVTLDLGRLASMVRGATRVIWAADGGDLIAFASALTDGAAFGFITNLVVREDHRRGGVGRAMIRRLMEGQTEVRFLIRVPRDAEEFCAQIGFAPVGDTYYALEVQSS